MTEQQIDRLVSQILQRMQPPLLVLVTPAAGYRQEIRQRLAGCGERLLLALDDALDDAEHWQTLGHCVGIAHPQTTPYKALLVPFLDYPLAADLLNGTLQHKAAQRMHDALLAGIPVLALRYHCDPRSELNQLRGAVDSDYAAHVSATLAGLAACGVTLCSINELLDKLADKQTAPTDLGNTRRYLTVTDIVNNPALADSSGAVLTDAAVDYVKTHKKMTLPR